MSQLKQESAGPNRGDKFLEFVAHTVTALTIHKVEVGKTCWFLHHGYMNM